MSLFYGGNPSTSSDFTKYSWSLHADGMKSEQLRLKQNKALVACASSSLPPARRARDGAPLGIMMKSHAKHVLQGFQSTHDYDLQDQSGKLLPKERVANCLKRRISKVLPRFVKYNEVRKKAHWAKTQLSST